MNNEIHKVITKNIKFMEIVVQSKGQVGKRPVKTFVADAFKSSSDALPVKGLDMDVGVGCYVRDIIK